MLSHHRLIRSDSVIFTLITIPGFVKFFFPSKGMVLHHVMITPVASAKPVKVMRTSLAVTLNVICHLTFCTCINRCGTSSFPDIATEDFAANKRPIFVVVPSKTKEHDKYRNVAYTLLFLKALRLQRIPLEYVIS